jgi:hypothetical protein
MPYSKCSRFFFLLALSLLALSLLAAALFCGCTPRQKGAATQGFFATGMGAFSVGVNPPLALASTGTLLGNVPSDVAVGPQATFTYALFSDNQEGPIMRHAHAIFSELPRGPWRWEMETWARPESLSYGQKSAGGRFWTIQILPVTAERDWFSALWQGNGRSTPDFWLAKRWSARPENEVRVVVEYRESAPLCMQERLIAADTARRTDRNAPTLRGKILHSDCERDLEEFSRRADAAVDLNGLEQLPGSPLQMTTVRPGFSPDMGKLVGRAEYVESVRPLRD